jgi:dGTPase
MTSQEALHTDEVFRAIQRAISRGRLTYNEILSTLGGADPALVRRLLDEINRKKRESQTHSTTQKENKNIHPLQARRLSANLPLDLPAPNPIISQWWFTLDTVCKLADRIGDFAKGELVAFLGTPTVGYHYAHCFNEPCTILDIDEQVLTSLKLPKTATTYIYDVNDNPPPNLCDTHEVVLIDPPWYQRYLYLFIARARALIAKDGFILCVLPSRLTRPGIIEERTELIERMLSQKFEVVSLESDYVQYRVPNFEARAYNIVQDFSGRWWRKGDLLVLRVQPDSKLDVSPLQKEIIEVFARKSSLKRFFLSPIKANNSLTVDIEQDSNFENTVSTRIASTNEIAIWGSNKKGAKLKDANLAREILTLWENKNSKELTTEILIAKHGPKCAEIITSYDASLDIWKDEQGPICRRSREQLEKLRLEYLGKFAAQPSGREYGFQPDEFRIDFQRDRDRILWSHSLGRLAGKTQLFPVKSDDNLRRRLAHSIEVMQLASTISTAFGLDRDLTEAGALAHDIGHTPFGHAGEFALNKAMNDIDTRLYGFNHYEHGVDVVRWLEDAYQSAGAGAFPGLNLTFQTIECIFKHTYFRGVESPIGQLALSKSTKHEDLKKDVSCHLEGQAVRAADKISYLISDLEDGIKMESINLEDLSRCKFFERPPMDIIPSPGESLFDRFISQRRAILNVLMEDILSATDQRLAGLSSLKDVRENYDYTVKHSDEIKKDIGEIWKQLQAGILHNNSAVKTENSRAARIIRDLFYVYIVAPHLVDERFQEAHRRLANSKYLDWYIKNVGPKVGIPKKNLSRFAYEHIIGETPTSQGDNWMMPTHNIVLAKDYVASLTDARAVIEHQKHFGSSSDYSVQ